MKAIVQHEYGAPQDVLHLAEWRCRPSVRRTCWCRCVYGFGHGAFAEYVAVPQGSLAPKPGNLSFEQAAAVPLAAVTALQGLRAGGLQPGQQILIAGASGGVGTFAVQIAGHVIDYTKHDFTLGAARYDLVLQLGGTYSPAAVRKVLTPDGTLIQFSSDGSRWFGPVGNILKAVALNPLAGQTLKSFTAKVTAQALTEVGDLIESGHITPVIDRTYPLTEAAAAVRLVEKGSPAGKVIVMTEPPPPEPPPQ